MIQVDQGAPARPEESDAVEGSMPAKSDRPCQGKHEPSISHNNHMLGGIRVPGNGDSLIVRVPPMAGEILCTDRLLDRAVTHDAEINDVDIGAQDLLLASGSTRRHADLRSEQSRVGSDRRVRQIVLRSRRGRGREMVDPSERNVRGYVTSQVLFNHWHRPLDFRRSFENERKTRGKVQRHAVGWMLDNLPCGASNITMKGQ